jgi:hypothetical protein
VIGGSMTATAIGTAIEIATATSFIPS